MSFIYSKKFNDTIVIFSDTKTTMDSSFTDKSYENKNEAKSIREYGMMKSYIITPTCVLAFAGVVKNANVLLSKLSAKNSIEEIKQICLQQHIDCKQETDFLLAFYHEEKLTILSIKNGKVLDVQNEWLGSQPAFAEFQKRSVKNEPLNRIEVKFINTDNFASIQTMQEYESLFDRFYNSAFSCNDSGVGSFIILLVFNSTTKRFEFRSYIRNQPSIKYTPTSIKETADKIIVNCLSSNLLSIDRTKGDYTVCFFGSCDNYVVIYVAEIFYAINFTRGRLDYKKTNSEFTNLCIAQSAKMSIYQLQYEMQGYGFTQPPMLPYSYGLLKSEILRFYATANKLISTDFIEVEKLMIFTVNNMFRQYIPLIENNPQEVGDFKEFIEFINTTEWKSCKMSVQIETKKGS